MLKLHQNAEIIEAALIVDNCVIQRAVIGANKIITSNDVAAVVQNNDCLYLVFINENGINRYALDRRLIGRKMALFGNAVFVGFDKVTEKKLLSHHITNYIYMDLIIIIL